MSLEPLMAERKAPPNQASKGAAGQFSMYANPPSVWPDFMVGQASHPVKVLLVDDDAHVRNVIAQELLADDRILLVAQAEGLKDGRRKFVQHGFDVLLVDLNLGDGSGFDLIAQVRSLRPSAEVIVISSLEDDECALRALDMGANGYLLKNSWFGNFPQAVLQVVNGGASLTPNLARRLLHRLDQKPAESVQRNARECLTDREREILKMVALGYTSAEIASRLTISYQTVNTHIRNTYQKIQVKNRAQAVMWASDRGLL
jgi:DNA-binding NarL/FixJ family response regulator